MINDLLWAAICIALGVGIAAIAWRNSPKARAAVGSGRVFIALMIEIAPWLLIPSVGNISHRLSEPMFGDGMLSYAAGGIPFLVVWIALCSVVPFTRDAVRDHARVYNGLAARAASPKS